MRFVATQFLTGLSGSVALFLASAGLTVTFGVTRVVNFAHGSLFMLGAYVGWSILSRLPRDPIWFGVGVAGATLAVAAVGAVLERAVLRRLYGAPALFQLLATFGVMLVAQDLTLLLWGPNDLPLSRPAWLRASVLVLGARFPLYDLILIAVGPAVLAGLLLLLARSRFGMLVRACTENREMAAALGINQGGLSTAVFALGAGLAGLGGVLILPDASANLQMDLGIIVEAFVVVVVGGMGSVAGAFLASVLVGELQAFGIVVMPRATLVLIFVIMAAVLTVRPHGLLGDVVLAEPVRRPGLGSRARVFRWVDRPWMAWVRTAWVARGRGRMIWGRMIWGRMIWGRMIWGRMMGEWVTWGGVLIAAMAPFWLPPYWLSLLTEVLIAALFASALHLIMGPGGMISFGHAAWFGLGAYGAALTASALAAPMPVALLAAPVVAGLAAAVFGWFVVRLSGVYLAMLTLAFAQIVWAMATQWSWLTGGDDGILGVWPSGRVAFFWWVLGLAFGGIWLLLRVARSPFGFALMAARDSEGRAMAVGLRPERLRVAAFAMSGAAAGLSGGLFAFHSGSVFPGYAGVGKSVDGLVMVLLGGIGASAGPVIGAAAYTGLYDVLIRTTSLWRLALGLVIIALVLVFPDGIAGGRRR